MKRETSKEIYDGVFGPHRRTESVLIERHQVKECELECVRWAIAGKTLEDIAVITGMNYRTVRYHLDNLRDRYGFSSRLQMLVRVAQEYNLDPMYDGRPSNNRNYNNGFSESNKS